jgi:basic membrane protein A
VRVGLVLSHFGLGDQSYNDMQYNGLIEAYIKYDINASFRVPKSDSPADIKIAFDELINGEQCNLIIAGEAWVMKDLVLEYANKIQNVDFKVLDYHFADRPNIITALFAQEQGSYAAGYLAARFSRSGRIGFIGGVDVPIVKEFETGFDKGARRGRADALIHKTYISRLPDFSGFVSPKKGYDQAINMYEAGVDIIFAVAGTTGNGVIQAARERGRYVIGVDSNQDHLAPGTVLTSMMKRLDRAIISLVGLKIQGRLRGGIHNFTYANGGISLTEMEFTRKMIPGEILTGLRSVEQELGATE